jgi:hypothetical protein
MRESRRVNPDALANAERARAEMPVSCANCRILAGVDVLALEEL